jgi:predicted signal transduction protein with EAL and GGDEF domain
MPVLYFLFHSGLNERFEDPSLTWLQVVIGTLVIMYVAYHSDSNRGIPLMLSLVVLAFGTFRFSTREFLVASGLVLAGYAAVINLLFWRKPDTVNVLDGGFQWVVLAFVLPCFALVGGRLSELRQRVRRTNDELTSALDHHPADGDPRHAHRASQPRLFARTLTRSIAQAERGRRNLALFFLDLDRFKNINDTLGHGAGDRVLQEAAQRAAAAVRAATWSRAWAATSSCSGARLRRAREPRRAAARVLAASRRR